MFLNLQNIDIGYDQTLIKDIKAGIHHGQITLVIGNNGVGKTTLLKTILQQIPPRKGKITLNGKDASTMSNQDIAMQIAMVFSKSVVPDHYTVNDLISLGKYIHYPYYFELNKTDKEYVSQVITSLNLERYKDYQLKNLSDGNLQKAFIGRALVQNSPMIILDEPTTHLDEENKIMILKLLRKLAEDHQKIILFSSHDWRLAKEFSDQIWLIKEQQLYSGISEDILQNHAELASPQLFDIHPEFIPPQIFAPDFQKELLYSFLQKNCKNDLSRYHFSYNDDTWVISHDNIQQNCRNFVEIKEFLLNAY